MTIYQSLKKDHDHIKVLLSSLVKATEKGQHTEKLLEQIEEELVPHSRAEEAIFYNTIREETDDAKLMMADSFREHAQAETLLRTLKGLETIGVEWKKAAEQLKDAVEHHIAEEETEVFAKAKEILTTEESQQLAKAFEQTKQEFKQQGNLKNIVQMVGNMLPKRFADRIRDTLKEVS
ncbi:MAG: hemerythrin domain-containing protein [Oligoflexus sp.]